MLDHDKRVILYLLIGKSSLTITLFQANNIFHLKLWSPSYFITHGQGESTEGVCVQPPIRNQNACKILKINNIIKQQ